MARQGFRKYLTQARDHEELLAFLLGQIVKEKARFYQLQHYQQPESITVKVSELDERVSFRVFPAPSRRKFMGGSQAKEHDIYDTSPFLRSKLFAANGYKLKEGTIEKTFKRADEM